MRHRRYWAPALALLSLALATGTAAANSSNIFRVAGTGAAGFSGDGGPAADAKLGGPRAVAWTADGGFLIADYDNSRVRQVRADGRITTVAGTGTNGYNGDGIPATSAQINGVHGVAPMPDGGFLIDDQRNQRIRRVWPDGKITTVAGDGVRGDGGDGGQATSARIAEPRGIAATGGGGFLVADSDNHRIRCVTPEGTITTVAGNGSPGFSGDEEAATKASLNVPFSVSPTFDGGFLIADNNNNRVRLVSADGTMRTVAGNGSPPDPAAGDGGPAPDDGGPATSAKVRPTAVAAVPGGGFLIADNVADRVRYVSPGGTITTIAGNGQESSSGADGMNASEAGINGPRGLAVRGDGHFLIAEFGADGAGAGGDRVLFIGTEPLAPPFPAAPAPVFPSDCDYSPDPGTTDPPKLVLRLASEIRRRAGSRASIRYRSTRPASVTASLFKGQRRIARVRRRARAGANRLRLRMPERSGRYVLHLRGRTADGRRDTVRARLIVARRR